MPTLKPWNIYLGEEFVGRTYFLPEMTKEEVIRVLIDKAHFDPAIWVIEDHPEVTRLIDAIEELKS